MSQNIAFVFPGQGSQSVGMLDYWNTNYASIVSKVCQEASDVLGYDMAALINSDADNKLNKTEYTQPALLTAGVVAWQVWQHDGCEQPKVLAGHSLGEYTALVCAKALTFAEALRLVAKRGELMQNAVAPGAGAMAAILGLDLATIEAICAELDNVEPANLNAPGQIVIAGTTEAIELAVAKAKTVGAKRAIILPVSVPSHCKLMRPAAEKLAPYLEAVQWKNPQLPVIHNYDVAAHVDSVSICNALSQQLYSPVRWIETIEYLVQQGIEEVIECGPGKVLTGLNKRIAPTLNNRAITETLGAELC